MVYQGEEIQKECLGRMILIKPNGLPIVLGKDTLSEAIVNKDDILAYFSRRSESEILIAAKDVHEQTIIHKDANAEASGICC